MIRGIFVTGTDTGVGKTWIAAGLVRLLRAAGFDAVPMKAVQTGGVRDGRGRLRAPDLDAVLAAAGLDPFEALRGTGLPVAGVVLNEAAAAEAGPAWIQDDNARTVEERGGVPVLARVTSCTGDLVALDTALAAIDVGELLGVASGRHGREGQA